MPVSKAEEFKLGHYRKCRSAVVERLAHKEGVTSGAKAPFLFGAVAAQLKPRPFKEQDISKHACDSHPCAQNAQRMGYPARAWYGRPHGYPTQSQQNAIEWGTRNCVGHPPVVYSGHYRGDSGLPFTRLRSSVVSKPFSNAS
jgi:hypothetical protein